MKQHKYIFLFLFFTVALLQGETFRVMDKKSGVPLAGANVVIVGSDRGTVSDEEGYFTLNNLDPGTEIRITYMGYYALEISWSKLKTQTIVPLMPTAIPMGQIVVLGDQKDWTKEEVTTNIRLLETEEYLRFGVTGPADVLAMEASIQITGPPDGSQYISIRGSNADEVLIVYDGLPLNTEFSGTFDLSLLNIYDIESFQILKGSHSTLFGSGAFGGVVNITPKISNDRHLELFARADELYGQDAGTNVYLHYKGLNTRVGIMSKYYKLQDQPIVRHETFYSLLSRYLFNNENILSGKILFRPAMSGGTTLPYANEEEHGIAHLSFNGSLGFLKDIQAEIAHKSYETESFFTQDSYHRKAIKTEKNRIYTLGKKMLFPYGSLQLRADMSRSEYTGTQMKKGFYIEPVVYHYDDILTKKAYDGVGILKLKDETGYSLIEWFEVDIALRLDRQEIRSEKSGEGMEYPIFREKEYSWQKFSRKMSFSVSSHLKNSDYVLYVLSGDNIRFPKLDELYRSGFTELGAFQDCTLVPERNVSFELGINGTGYPQGTWGFLDKVEYAFSYFNNRYENKIYEVFAMRKDPTPVNSANTSEIYGVDLSLTATTLHGALEIQGGSMLLDISDIRVFQNKPEYRHQLEFRFHPRKTRYRFRFFLEGRQSYYYSQTEGISYQGELEGRKNMDIYVSRDFKTGPLTWTTGGSVRNLFSNHAISYLDRRYWMISLNMTW